MEKLNEIINGATDAREVKRALCVKMRLSKIETKQICMLLNVSPQYVSKWSVIYETQGAASLKVGYAGSESYLSEEARQKTVAWIQEHETISVEALRDYLETHHGVVYQSKQSYYDLLAAAGMSYHKTEKKNPKQDEAQVLTRRAEIKKNWKNTKKRLPVAT